MSDKLNKISNNLEVNLNNIYLSLIIATIIYPLLWIWQGGDLTDSGYFAYNYQNFFLNLKLGVTESISFLADLIGAIWLHVFPKFGILGLNILFLIFFYFTVYIVYLTLRLQFPKSTLLLFSIFCGVLFSIRHSHYMYSRDVLSFFLLICLAYYLLKSYIKNNHYYIIIAGFFFGLAALSRLPNIIFLFFLPIFGYYCIKDIKVTSIRDQLLYVVRIVGWFALGLFILLATFAIILHIFNLHHVFLNNLGFLGDFASATNNSSYSANFLIKIYYLETIQKFLPHAIIVWSFILNTIVIAIYSRITRKYFAFFIILGLFFYVAFRTYADFSFRSHIRYLVPAVCMVPLIYSLIKKDKFALLAIIGISITISQVVGSNTGLYNKMSFGLLLLLPLTFIIVDHYYRFKYKGVGVNIKVFILIIGLFISFFSFFTRWGGIFHVGSGYKIRLRAVHSIDHPRFKGIYTVKDMSDHIAKLSSAIGHHKTDNNSLFIFGHQPMFYYLTSMRAPIKDIWLINSIITADDLFKRLSKSIKENNTYPLIVDTKNSKMGQEGDKKLLEFLEYHGYLKVEEDTQFAVWKKL